MKESRKEFIKKAHSAACSEWKANIKAEFPKLFKKDDLVVGKWYKYPDFENWKLLIKDNTKGKEKGVGFNCSGIWMKDWSTTGIPKLDRLIPCLDEEVKQVLIKEAKKRGFFKIGNKFNSLFDDNNAVRTISKYDLETEIDYYYDDNELRSEGLETYGELCSNPLIFKDGIWATIVETITKEEAEKELGKTIID